MTELITYGVVFLLLIAHTLMAGKMYKAVHANQTLSMKEKNDWKLKALLLPGYFWGKYKASLK
ncbi:hypothetical protein [Cecembia calidifontis]|jgi:hypothetical protein|uniref:Uncharacterized protein n=1 Tax=Cecembia calidifontis TaxID=1187080 RepID=A0A4V2F6A5_9BACT|nr:hypothetical protein [Cecembia calidifontis]RZS95639.1 hypothetical protein BC751_1175 [Cecembia calidifontis]